MLTLINRNIRDSIDWFMEHLVDAPETDNSLSIHILLDVWFAVIDATSRAREGLPRNILTLRSIIPVPRGPDGAFWLFGKSFPSPGAATL